MLLRNVTNCRWGGRGVKLRGAKIAKEWKCNIYLDQSSVLSVVDIFPNALFPVTCQRPWRSLWARKALTSWFAIIALVSTLSHGPLRAGWSRSPWWSRGTRAPRDTWDSWCATTATLTASRLNFLNKCRKQNEHLLAHKSCLGARNGNIYFSILFEWSLTTLVDCDSEILARKKKITVIIAAVVSNGASDGLIKRLWSSKENRAVRMDSKSE